jgi:hypothetical protein
MISKNFLDYFLQLKASGYTDKDMVNFVSSYASEFFKNDVDEESFKHFTQPLQKVFLTEELENEDDRAIILKDTIFQYELLNETDYDIIKNDLIKLSMYDKVIEEDGVQYFFLIDLLFQNYILHKQVLGSFDNRKKLELRGVTFSSSHSPEKIISREHNAVKTAMASMPDNEELKFRNNLYTKYKDNPHAVSKTLHTVNLLGGIKSLSEEKNAYLTNSRAIISSALPFDKKDIYKSANLVILLLFRKDSVFQKAFERENTISNNQIISINGILMDYILDTKNQLNKDNVTQVVQAKDDFDATTIYEFQNDKNKKTHPMLEDTEENQNFWNELTEFFKKNIPPKSDDK